VRRFSGVLAIAVALALGLVACGDDEEGTPAAPQTATQTTDQTETTAADPKDTSVKPVIEKPSGSPPRRLQKEDIVKGKGPAAKAGDSVTMQYVGVSFSNGEQFDASWDSGQPFPFQLGAGMVIQGWDQGMVGMKAGGRRLLVIPPDLGYGPSGSGPIGPNETLIFVVDLVKLG
jgi:peptidylprolyl isomerase